MLVSNVYATTARRTTLHSVLRHRVLGRRFVTALRPNGDVRYER
jgi:hypothetical protein